MIEAKITLCSHQRDEPAINDVRKTEHAQYMHEPEQGKALGQSGNELWSMGKAVHISSLCEKAYYPRSRKKLPRRIQDGATFSAQESAASGSDPQAQDPLLVIGKQSKRRGETAECESS